MGIAQHPATSGRRAYSQSCTSHQYAAPLGTCSSPRPATTAPIPTFPATYPSGYALDQSSPWPATTRTMLFSLFLQLRRRPRFGFWAARVDIYTGRPGWALTNALGTCHGRPPRLRGRLPDLELSSPRPLAPGRADVNAASGLGGIPFRIGRPPAPHNRIGGRLIIARPGR